MARKVARQWLSVARSGSEWLDTCFFFFAKVTSFSDGVVGAIVGFVGVS